MSHLNGKMLYALFIESNDIIGPYKNDFINENKCIVNDFNKMLDKLKEFYCTKNNHCSILENHRNSINLDSKILKNNNDLFEILTV